MSIAKLKLLWHSVAPWIRSGYGNVTNQVVSRLVKFGFDVMISAYYGTEPGGELEYNGVKVVSSKEGPFGIDSASKYARRYGCDAGLLFTDWWAFSNFPKILPRPILYGPMDHTNYSEEILNFTRMYSKIISLCKWQQDYLKSVGIESDMIYHGVDTSVFKPLNKAECRKRYGIPEGVFVIGSVRANSDKEDRKGHTRDMKAVSYWLEQHPEIDRKKIVWMYHTVANDPRGMPLTSIAHKYGLDDIIKFMDPSQHDTMISTEDLVKLMNTFDFHLMCSKREGFGLTLLETMACGVPNITHNFSSMTELVEGHGWLCKSLGTGLNLETTPINAETAHPDVYSIVDCIEEAYFKDDLRKKYGKESRKFALKFNWDDLVVNEWVPVLDSLLEDKCIDDRRLI